MGWDILEKEEEAEKGGVKIEDWGTSAHLYWSFKKISCKACLIFHVILVTEKVIVSKSSIFLQTLIIEFFWFAQLWLKMKEKRHTKAFVDMSTRGGVLAAVLPGRGANNLPVGSRGLTGELGGYKMNFIQDSFQKFSPIFKSPSHWLRLGLL